MFRLIIQCLPEPGVSPVCRISPSRALGGQVPQMNIRSRLRNAYAMLESADAKGALDGLWRQLTDLNPSAARSLEEGVEQMLTCIGFASRPSCAVTWLPPT